MFFSFGIGLNNLLSKIFLTHIGFLSIPGTSSKITRTKTCPRSFHSKLRSFYRKLEQKGYGQGPTKLK